MMKHLLFSVAVLSIVVAACFGTADDKPKAGSAGANDAAQKAPRQKDAQKPAAQPAKPAPAAAKAAPKATAPVAAKTSPDEDAVRQIGDTLVEAYNQRDGKAFAAAFTADGEYVDEKGTIFHGRQAIEDEFAGFFAAHPSTSIEVRLAATRAIAPAVIAADGTTRFSPAKGGPSVAGRCHLVCTKENGQWFIASLHEIQAGDERPAHHEQIQQLDFLLGDWIDEGAHSHVHFTCRLDEGQNFLLRDFAVHFAGQKTMTGMQRIGYDPLTGHLKAWIFDSAGGYADGYFHREGERWVLQTTGVTADGRMASGTQLFSRIDNHRTTWQAVDYVIGGERIPDIPPVTIVRKAPGPTARVK